MSDYISREALIGKVEKHYCAPCKGQGGDLNGDWCRACVINSVLERVRGIPAADVVEVVRCRECVHWKPTGSKAGNSFSDMEYIGGCEFTKYCRRESDFCSYGERKGGAD